MKLKKKLLSAMLSISLGISLLAPAGLPAQAATVLDADVTSASSGCTILGIEGRYITDAQNALNKINEIRKEACDKGVPDPNNPSDKLESSDYHPLTWSTALEYIARIRAVETGITLGHLKLNDLDHFSYTTSGGTQSYGECVAFNNSTSLIYGIEQWYEEKTDWVNQNTNAVTGHYTIMINPEYNYVGLGDFYNSSAQYPNTLAGEFGYYSGNQGSTYLPAYADAVQKVDVKDNYITYSLSAQSSSVKSAESTACTLSATITYSNSKSIAKGNVIEAATVPEGVTYSSSNTSVATVSSDGTVRGVAAGTAVITASVNGKSAASCTITVTAGSSGTGNNSSGNGSSTTNNNTSDNGSSGTNKSTGTSKFTRLSAGSAITVRSSNARFKVTKSGKVKKGKVTGAEVAYVRPFSKKASVTIPATIKYKGVTYRVTSIASKAFKNNAKVKTVKIGKYVRTIGTSAFENCKKLKSVTLGSSTVKIGSKAFYKCKSLKTIVIQSAKLKSVGKKAISGINKKATIKVKKKCYNKYKKLFKSSVGYKKTMKFKKI